MNRVLLFALIACLSKASSFAQDGSLDLSFDPGNGFNSITKAVAVQPDGKILVGGWFDEFETSQAANIVRLNSDGTIDASFDSGTGVNAYGIEDFAVQPNGRIVITGQYGEVNGTESIMVSRLMSDGTLDNSFQMDTAINWYAGVSLQLQPDDKIILGGWLFTWPNNQDTAMNIVRLNVDGSIDQSFDPGTGVDGSATVWDLALQSDGKILLAGVISHVDGIPRNFIARLNNSSISSVGEHEEYSVSIYPNPAKTNLTIESRTPLAQLWVRDVAGRGIMNETLRSAQSDKKTLDISNLPSGIYLVEVLTQNGQRAVQKVVVE